MDTKQKKSTWSKKRIFLIGVIAIAVLIPIGLMVAWILTTARPSNSEERPVTQADIEKGKVKMKEAESDAKLQREAAEQVAAKNPNAAEKLYEDAASAAATAERKTLLYIDLSAVYYDEGRYEEAFAAAKKAEVVNQDKYLIADWLSRLYEDRKDYVNAAKYYRLAGEWADSAQNKTGIDKATYDQEADRVSKLIPGDVQ